MGLPSPHKMLTMTVTRTEVAHNISKVPGGSTTAVILVLPAPTKLPETITVEACTGAAMITV